MIYEVVAVEKSIISVEAENEQEAKEKALDIIENPTDKNGNAVLIDYWTENVYKEKH